MKKLRPIAIRRLRLLGREGLPRDVTLRLGVPRKLAKPNAYSCPFQVCGTRFQAIRHATAADSLGALKKALVLLEAELVVLEHLYGGDLSRSVEDQSEPTVLDVAKLRQGLEHFNNGRYGEAFTFLESFANLGVPDAQAILGNMYQLGWGVSQDGPAAVRWYSLAAAQGDAVAYQNLGTLYMTGMQGVPVDREKGDRCFRKAAKLGFAGGVMSVDMQP